MKKVKIFIYIISTVVVVFGLALYFSPAFVEFTLSSFFNARKSLWINSVKNDFKNQNFAKYSKFTMKDDSWVVLAMNHDCCSGDGFNCVITKDNAGTIMIDEKKNFCGVEAMGSQLRPLASDSIAVFYSGLASIGLNLNKISE